MAPQRPRRKTTTPARLKDAPPSSKTPRQKKPTASDATQSIAALTATVEQLQAQFIQFTSQHDVSPPHSSEDDEADDVPVARSRQSRSLARSARSRTKSPASTKLSHSQVGQSDNANTTKQKKFSSGESSSDEDEDDLFSTYDRPTTSYGSLIGQNVTPKLRTQIKENKFVEMSQLLPLYTLQQEEELTMKIMHDHTTRLIRNKKKHDLPFHHWCDAFDIFISIYVECATSATSAIKLTKSLLTYKKEITHMKRAGHDWQSYDRHFHQDREAQPFSWATTRTDLLLQYGHDGKHSFRPTSTSKPTQRSTVPTGYCFNFHVPERRCHSDNCKYKHSCPRCNKNHPAFRSCSAPNTPKNPPATNTKAPTK